MDYQRIYNEFIDDRRSKEANLVSSSEYREIHHIKPKSLGGSNAKENLIGLTPEDHIFAHLLLARLHGGLMWAAFMMMSNGGRWKSYEPRYKAMYGAARRAFSAAQKGKEGKRGAENGNHNPEIFDWVNLESEKVISATLHDMWSTYGGNRASWTSVLIGDKPSVLKWTTLDRMGSKTSSKGKEFEFVNRDGRVFRGTQKEFMEVSGLSCAQAHRIVYQGSVSRGGWRESSTKDRMYTTTKENGRPARLGTGRVIRVESESGNIVEGYRQEVAKELGCTPQQLSAGLYYAKKKGVPYKGWTPIE